MIQTNPTLNAHSPRRAALLKAATGVFARYGYRKTSMDEVARAAGVSRQGLYLQYTGKEDLFRAVVDFGLASQLDAATAMLTDQSLSMEARLIAACDAWAGTYVGVLGVDAADLGETSTVLTGEILAKYGNRFEQEIAEAIATSPLMPFYASAGLLPIAIARTLHATLHGLKRSCTSRQAFTERVAIAVRILFAPLAS